MSSRAVYVWTIIRGSINVRACIGAEFGYRETDREMDREKGEGRERDGERARDGEREWQWERGSVESLL